MKTKLFLMSCFSMAIMLFAGCGDSDDGSGFVEETGGTNANVPAMSASEAKEVCSQLPMICLQKLR